MTYDRFKKLSEIVVSAYWAWQYAADVGYGKHTLPLDRARIDRRIGHLRARTFLFEQKMEV